MSKTQRATEIANMIASELGHTAPMSSSAAAVRDMIRAKQISAACAGDRNAALTLLGYW